MTTLKAKFSKKVAIIASILTLGVSVGDLYATDSSLDLGRLDGQESGFRRYVNQGADHPYTYVTPAGDVGDPGARTLLQYTTYFGQVAAESSCSMRIVTSGRGSRTVEERSFSSEGTPPIGRVHVFFTDMENNSVYVRLIKKLSELSDLKPAIEELLNFKPTSVASVPREVGAKIRAIDALVRGETLSRNPREALVQRLMAASGSSTTTVPRSRRVQPTASRSTTVTPSRVQSVAELLEARKRRTAERRAARLG